MRPLALWLGVGLLLVGDTEFEPDLDRAGLPRLVHPVISSANPPPTTSAEPGLRLRAGNGWRDRRRSV